MNLLHHHQKTVRPSYLAAAPNANLCAPLSHSRFPPPPSCLPASRVAVDKTGELRERRWRLAIFYPRRETTVIMMNTLPPLPIPVRANRSCNRFFTSLSRAPATSAHLLIIDWPCVAKNTRLCQHNGSIGQLVALFAWLDLIRFADCEICKCRCNCQPLRLLQQVQHQL